MRLSVTWSYILVGFLVACSPDEPDAPQAVKVAGAEDAATPRLDAGRGMNGDSAMPMDGSEVVDSEVEMGVDDGGMGDAGEAPNVGDLDAGDVDAWVEEVRSSVGPGRTDIKHLGPCQVELDEGDDGIVNERTTYAYDEAGNVQVEETDSRALPGGLADGGTLQGADWIPDSRITRTYDGSGGRTSRAEDWDADGNIDFYATYNSSGDRVSEAFDRTDDGQGMDLTQWAYRSDRQISTVERVWNADDGQEHIRTHTRTYDGDGKILEEAHTADDGATVTRRLTWTYNAAGYLLIFEDDSDADGIPESRDTWTYGASEHPLTFAEDGDADGTPESRKTWAYAGDGTLTSEDVDGDGDGMVDERSTFDADGNVLTFEKYDGGVLEYRIEYTYNSLNTILTSSDYDGSGVLQRTMTYSYDGVGRLLEEGTDSDANGAVDRITRYTYAAEGVPLAVADDLLADGSDVRTRLAYEHDESGNLRVFSKDTNADGVADDITTYLYGCW